VAWGWELRLEGELAVLHDGVAGGGCVPGVVVAVVGSAALVTGQRGGDDDGGYGVEVARLDGAPGDAARHGDGEGVEFVLHGLEALGVAQEAGVAPHIVAEILDPTLSIGVGGGGIGGGQLWRDGLDVARFLRGVCDHGVGG
jgi:hypothetical protein